MRQAAKDALRAAALRGVRQITGTTSDGTGGLCGIGVLMAADIHLVDALVLQRVPGCHLCGARYFPETHKVTKVKVTRVTPIEHEAALVVHLNDDHRLDFLAIAEKMPLTEEG